MSTLLFFLLVALLLIFGLPLLLWLAGLAVGVVVKLAMLFLLVALPVLLVLAVVRMCAWLVGGADRREAGRSWKEAEGSMEEPALRRRLARLDRRMRRLEELLFERSSARAE